MSFSSGRNISNNVNTDEAQTLTNKTIDSANNSLVVDADTATVSNIEADNLKAGVIDNDLSSTSVNDDTVPSAKAAKAYTDAAASTASSNLTTHETSTTGVHGVTGDIVGTSDTQTLTNKTLSGLASNSLEIQFPDRLDVKQGTTNDLEIYATSATDGQVVYDIDQKKYFGIVDNALVALGGGLGSPQTVAVVTADDAQNASDFSGLNSDIVTGGGTFGGTLTQSETASDLLTGVTKVFKYVAGATSQFDFFGYDLAIPQGFAGRTLAVELTYRTDATYSNGDFSVEILSNNGVTTSYLNNKVNLLDSKVSADGNGETVRYLVNVPADCETLKVAFQNLSATSGIEFYVDKISLDIDDFNYKNVTSVNSVELNGTDGRVITADAESISWNGSGNGWTSGADGSNFTNGNYYEVQFSNSIVEISGNIAFTATINNYIGLYLNGVFYKIVSAFNSSTRKKFQFISKEGEFSAGDKLSFGSINAGFTSNTSNTLSYLRINEFTRSKHVVVDSGEADTEYFYVNYQSNFWDLTTSTDEWDHSLMRDSSGAADPSASSSNFFTISDVSGQTRITAKDRITLNVSVTSSMDLNGSVRIHNSNGDILQQAQADASGGYKRTTAAEVTLESGDYLYIENTDPFSDRAGSVTITAQKAQRGEYHLVPVNDQENVFSATISNPAGTATLVSESSPFIESVSRTSLGKVAIVFKSGVFTEAPHIIATAFNDTGLLGFSAAIADTPAPSASGCTIEMVRTVDASLDDWDFNILVQKKGADYKEPKAFIGDVPLNYTQTKYLASPVSSNGVDLITFNNLNPNKLYEFYIECYWDATSDSFQGHALVDSSNNILSTINMGGPGGSGNAKNTMIRKITPPADGIVKWRTISSVVGTIRGNGTDGESLATVTELNHTQETTRF